MNKNLKYIIGALIIIAILVPTCGMVVMKKFYDSKFERLHKASLIVINKQDMTLKVYGIYGNLVADFPVGVGKAYGNKVEKGDNRTPEGVFHVSEIQEASNWKHDFGDGKGEIPGAYGPWFIRLYTEPHKGIGIHGTHLPESIGTRCTEGCIRINNDDLLKLKEKVKTGLTVKIIPGPEDIKVNQQEARR